MKYKRLLIICWAVITAAVGVYGGIGPSRSTTPGSKAPDRDGDVAPSSITKEPPSTNAASVSLLGNPIPLYTTTAPIAWVCQPPNNPPPNYVWFDGPVAPVSYRNPTTGDITVSLFAADSIGGNRQLVGTLNASNTPPIMGLAPANSTPSYRSHFLSLNPQSFQWGEWLYGGFFNAGTKKLYSFIYNEWHGPNHPNPCATPNPPNYLGADGSWYTAMGLAASTDFGATVSPIAAPPAHIVARATFGPSPAPQTNGNFIGMAGTTVVLSPKDNRFYAFEKFSNIAHTINNAHYVMRTDNLDDPQSWRVWDGTGFNASFYPPNSPPGWDGTVNAAIDTHGLAPLYLGWSKYFQRFIAVGWFTPPGLTTDVPNPWGFSLSDDLVHWDPVITFPSTPPMGQNFSTTYPALVDPSMLQNYPDSRAASNNYSGETPYLTYMRQYNDGRSELVMQKLQFAGGPGPTPPVAVQNISIGGIVRPGDGALIAGFEIGPGNPKTIIIRGLGPSLVGGLNTPTLTLYNSAGAPIKSNTGWSNNSSTDLALMSAVLPTAPGDCALVYGNFTAGFYSVVLSGGSIGAGLIELYDVTLQSTTPSLNSKLKSFSARGYVTPTGPMTMGFILGATRSGILRATSLSTLSPYLSPVLPDPMLTLYNYLGTPVRFNDNWMDNNPDQIAIQQSGYAPGNPLEPAMYPSMGANLWTARVEGHAGQSGYALFEFFDLTCVAGSKGCQ